MKVLVGFLQASVLLFLVSCTGLAANSRLVELFSITLDSRDPERREFGALTLMGAFQLRSSDRRFGGLSGLSITPDNRLYAVSDRGHWMAARMVFESDGHLADLTDWEIKPLLSPDKIPVKGVLTDAEALARAPDDSFIVAFEQAHRVWRYPPPPASFNSPPLPVAVPPELAKAPANGGVEAIAVLPDGRILALTEEFQDSAGTYKGWLIDNGRFAEVSYMPSDGFRVSDCVALKNGDVIVLERSYTFPGTLRARVKLVTGKSIRPGARLSGDEILRLDPPLANDNFEGIAVHEDPVRGTVIYLVSDDNFHPFLRTLLLQFRFNKRHE
jgi:hypothetical protein